MAVLLLITFAACGGVSSSPTPPTNPAPTVSFSGSPTSINSGQSVTLTWTTTNATAFTISPAVSQSALPTSGSQAISPTATTTYTATATGAGGSVTAQVTITVTATANPTIQFSASPTSITAGGSSTLTWTTTNATAVNIDNGVGASLPANGTATVTPSATITYTATATGAAGTTPATATATVTVTASGPGDITAIKHIIFMVQENRSLDHYFGMLGAYKQSEGWTGTWNGVPLNASLPDYKGTGNVSPFHEQTVCIDNVSPAWNEAHYAVHSGKMDFFMKTEGSLPSAIDTQGTRMMGYYDQTDLPYYYELASQYATSDTWFSPLLSDTKPNRMYLLTGTSFGHIRPSDVPPTGGWPQPTIFRTLTQNHISWRYYYQDSSVYLASFSDWATLQGNVYNISHYFTDIQNPSTMPQVIFIERGGQIGTDEHPSANIQKGEVVVANIINSFLQSPIYQNSVFILTYDEGGQLYDHVPPFTEVAPDTIPPMLLPGDLPGTFGNSGYRVPLIVVSPFVKPQYVSHVNRDYTAILKFIETRFKLPPLTARDAAQDDMTEMFDFSAPQIPTPPPLPQATSSGKCNPNLEKAPGF
jgi:phospholipase C